VFPQGMTRRVSHGFMASLLVLAGCASSGYEYWGAERETIVIEGRHYEVFAKTDESTPRVQVIRMGYARRPEHTAILLAMVQAAEQSTGCVIVEGSAVGDSGVMEARLSCPE